MHLSRLFPLALVALVAAAPAAQPDLRISSFLEEGDQQAEAGDRVTVEYTVTNSGDQDVEDVPVAFYFSNDAAFDDAVGVGTARDIRQIRQRRAFYFGRR